MYFLKRKLQKFISTQKAFTLIELLIVITIITIMMTIGMVTYQNIAKQTRDAKRMGDIEAVTKALELYFSQHQSYPDFPPITSSDSAWNLLINTTLQGYLERNPLDPINQPPFEYYYERTSIGSYIICAQLELGESAIFAECGKNYLRKSLQR